MPRSMWKGVIQLGLLVIPVKLYKATEEGGGVSLHMLCKEDGQRINMKVHCPTHGEIERADTLRGYEYEKDNYVVLSEAELDSLKVASLRALTIETFVPLDRLPFVKGTYYVAPDPLAVKAFALLRQVMLDADVQGIVKITFRDRETLAALAPFGSIMTLSTMHWPDEVRGTEDLAIKVPPTSQAELAMARTLVDSMTGEFEPERYSDNYRAALVSLIEDKIAGRAIAPADPGEPVTPPPDLMAMLAASVEASKERRGRA